MGAEEFVVEEPMKRVSSLSEMVLQFLEEDYLSGGGERRFDDTAGNNEGYDSDGGRDDDPSTLAQRVSFWQEQPQLLHDAMSKNSATEARIRAATENLLRKMRSSGNVCTCSNNNGENCRNCLLNYVAVGLKDVGYNSAICKCTWSRSPDIPSGEHRYIDVVVEAKKGKNFRVVIELNFRAEFEVARASEEYNSLISKLPEVFVGKTEKLRSVIRITCAAGKQCMKDNKMHMGPWRKHKYMESKWLGTCERLQSHTGLVLSPEGVMNSDRPSKMRASMLTFDLHRPTAVKVV